MSDPAKPLRVLHIGNVANYAYNIGKILQTDNIVSHAISWDYYHINAQPVWEEGIFDAGAIGDQYFPRLPAAKDAGFTVPDWYIQGPRVLACLALIAGNEGKIERAEFYRRALDRHLQEMPSSAYRVKMAAGRQRMMELVYTDMLGGFGRNETLSAVVRISSRLLYGMLVGIGMEKTYWGGRRRLSTAKWKILNQIDASRSAGMRLGARLPSPIKSRLKALLLKASVVAPGTPQAKGALLENAPGNTDHLPHNLAKALAQNRHIEAMLSHTGEKRFADTSRMSGEGEQAHPDTGTAACQTIALSPFEAKIQALITQYKAVYPDRDFDPELLRQYEHTLPLMSRLFSHYDLVIGYAIEGIWPLMADVPYVAYEFGTIRNLPFQDTPTGRLAALCYLNCEQTIVTNSDNEAPARRLGRPYFFLPHVVNESGLLSAEQAATARAAFVAEHGGDFIVFHPPRQHWDEQRDTSWDKGNDHLFRGFARLVKEHAPQARCIAVAWGETLGRSKELIEELGITENVIWITPQPHIAMMRYIGICDVLCDQFTIPTFGGIPPKAFHAGKPVVTSFDPELHRWCFNELPPLMPANSAPKAYEALVRLYTDKAFAVDLGLKGADWYRRENANTRIRQVLMTKLKGLEAHV